MAQSSSKGNSGNHSLALSTSTAHVGQVLALRLHAESEPQVNIVPSTGLQSGNVIHMTCRVARLLLATVDGAVWMSMDYRLWGLEWTTRRSVGCKRLSLARKVKFHGWALIRVTRLFLLARLVT